MGIVKRFVRFVRRKKASHVWPMIIFLIIYLIWFHIIEIIPRRHYIQVILPVDRLIPFIEVFVVPYLSWFFYVGLGITIVYLKDRDAYDRMCTVLMIGMTVFLLVSTFLPNRQPLRLTQMPRENIFTDMIIALWKTDTPTNVWPSIHVFNTAAVELAYLTSKNDFFRKNYLFRCGTLVWGILIIMSTVFIKQHSLFDVLSALSIIAVCLGWVYFADHVFRFRKWDVFIDRFERKILEK